jgi:aryl sulfotransferase
MTDTILWPRKTRALHHHHFDATLWNHRQCRDDDIIMATSAKSGTTWMQQIIAQLLYGPDADLEVAEMSPWLDRRVPPQAVTLPVVEAQTHRRFLKTPLPVAALVFAPQAKYLSLGRDGRDVVCSLYNHHANANQPWYAALHDTPGRVGPPIAPPPSAIRQYWRAWLARDGSPFWSCRENVRTWWAIRRLPNVRFVHVANLKRDRPGQMRHLAAFLASPINATRWDTMLD